MSERRSPPSGTENRGADQSQINPRISEVI
jgi:hypothetical protein